MNRGRHLPRTLRAALIAGLLLILAACSQPPQSVPGPDGPARIWFVSNTAQGPSYSGDLEAPFASLSAAEAASGPGDTIFIFAGDGSSRNQDRGITLKPGQRLIGEAVGLASAGIAPGAAAVVGNANGSAIVLAADNAVRGLRIESPQAAGIVGSDVGNLDLHAVTILGAGASGIGLEAAGDAATTVVASQLTVIGSGEAGMRLIARGSSEAHLDLTGSRLADNRGSALQLDYLGSGGGRFDIDNLRVRTLGASGIRVVSSGSASQLIEGRIVEARVTSGDPDGAGNGITVIVEGNATALVELRDNSVARFGSYGIDLASRGGSGVLEATVTGNAVSDPAANALAGMRLNSGNGAAGEANALCLNLADNRSTDGAIPGYLQRGRSGTDYRLHGLGDAANPAAGGRFLAARNVGSLTLGGDGADGAPLFTGGDCRRPEL